VVRGGGLLGVQLHGLPRPHDPLGLWTPNDADVVLINKGAPFEEVRESSRKTTISMAEDVAEKLALWAHHARGAHPGAPHSALRQLQLGTS